MKPKLGSENKGILLLSCTLAITGCGVFLLLQSLQPAYAATYCNPAPCLGFQYPNGTTFNDKVIIQFNNSTSLSDKIDTIQIKVTSIDASTNATVGSTLLTLTETGNNTGIYHISNLSARSLFLS